MSRLSSGECSRVKRRPKTEKCQQEERGYYFYGEESCVMIFWNYFKNPKTTLESNKPRNNGLVLFRITHIECLNY